MRGGRPFAFVVPGPPCVLKNSKIIVRKPFPRLVSSEGAQRWMKRAVAELLQQKKSRGWSSGMPFTDPVWCTIKTYAPTRHRRDLDNSLSGPLDALVKAGVIKDDSQVVSLDGSRLFYDKHNPRVEITLRVLW